MVWNETEQKLEDVIKSTIVEIRDYCLKRVLRDQTVRNSDKASTAKNKNSPIAISACLSVNSTPAKKWVRAPSPRVLHHA